ncbi:MAG: hypothetical protein JWM44_3013 [Bacilli bacterium]|nr:hypothetical protein [Bacilli bacterium]
MKRYPEAYIEYLVYFHTVRDFFECHEVLEAYWKSIPESSLRQAWHGLIQTAVALYHQRRGNIAGARKMMESAVRLLTDDHLDELGIDALRFKAQLKNRLKQLQDTPNIRYEDLNIPLVDLELLQLCKDHPLAVHAEWYAISNMNNPQIIHKHTQRDRSEVVAERQKQLLHRKLQIEG